MSVEVNTITELEDSSNVAQLPAGLRPAAAELPEKLTLVECGAPSSTAARPECELCGQPARVHVLEDYGGGRPVVRRFCLRCADAPSFRGPERPARAARLGLAQLVALAGLVLGAGAILADALVPEGHAGFGWYQRSGVVVGALLVFIGVLSRADLLALGGVFLFTGALCADWFGLTRGPGIGWKQQTMLAVGASCLVLALFGRLTVKLIASRAARSVSQGRASGDAAALRDGAGPAIEQGGAATSLVSKR